MEWKDAGKTLSLQLARGSRLLAPEPQTFAVNLAGATRTVAFAGKPIQVSF
jgi:hypothetical protein